MPERPRLPGPGADADGAEPVFHAPWQARLFAITVGLVERGLLTWPDWTAALAAACADADPEEGAALPGDPARDAERYYRAWAGALAGVLADRGVTSAAEIDDCAAAWQQAAARTPHGRPIDLGR